jgi:HEPN domain-containing protein
MKPITEEWVEKAEGDFASMGREIRARKRQNHDGACFHAQQCVEKYLKAKLQEESITFTRTHDLAVLLALLLPVEPTWVLLEPDMNVLTEYAVRFRYPGDVASRTEALDASRMCKRIRLEVRKSLGLPT